MWISIFQHTGSAGAVRELVVSLCPHTCYHTVLPVDHGHLDSCYTTCFHTCHVVWVITLNCTASCQPSPQLLANTLSMIHRSAEVYCRLEAMISKTFHFHVRTLCLSLALFHTSACVECSAANSDRGSYLTKTI